MKLVIVGVNHELLDMDEREIYCFRESDKLLFSTQLLDEGISQTLILSTCNRSEVYVVVEDSFDEERLKDIFLSYFHQNNHQVEIRSGYEAMEYLLEVACGIKSMVVGEDQILHQLKDAFKWTLSQKFSGKEMNYIFQTVIAFAKDMRKKYAMSEHPLSVSYIGYLQIKSFLQTNDKIMICGIGEMAQLMIEYLKDYDVYLVNRTYAHVKEYLNERRHFVPFEKRYEYLETVNVIITATASPHTIFHYEYMHVDHPLLFLDLAVPRDVDENVRKMKEITLIDMDDLKHMSYQHLQERKAICQVVQEECERQAHHMKQELQMMKSDMVIQKMQSYYLNASEDTYLLLKRKLNLNAREDYILKKVLKTSFLRLMKEPLQVLKQKDGLQQEQYIAMIEDILKEEHE